MSRHVAENVVERAVVDGKSRVACHGDRPEHLAGGRGDVEGIEIDPRPHDVAHGPLPEPQRLDRHRLLHRLEDSLCPPRLKKVLDVVHRHRRAVLLV